MQTSLASGHTEAFARGFNGDPKSLLHPSPSHQLHCPPPPPSFSPLVVLAPKFPEFEFHFFVLVTAFVLFLKSPALRKCYPLSTRILAAVFRCFSKAGTNRMGKGEMPARNAEPERGVQHREDKYCPFHTLLKAFHTAQPSTSRLLQAGLILPVSVKTFHLQRIRFRPLRYFDMHLYSLRIYVKLSIFQNHHPSPREPDPQSCLSGNGISCFLSYLKFRAPYVCSLA